jgi:hypothetical protein
MNGDSQIAAIRSSILKALALSVSVACIFSLNVWPRPVFAIGCTEAVGQVTASPLTIDREATRKASDPSYLTTTLTWSVDRKSCLGPLTITIERRTTQPGPPGGIGVPLSGQMPFGDVTTTTTFVLQAEHRDLASATVTVIGDPGFITVSSGKQITADDITKFNQQWMQPWQTSKDLYTAQQTLSQLDSSGTTGNGERMAAMVRMYDLTHDTPYLDHLFDLVQIVLKYRDDRPLDGGPKVTDEIRNKVGLAAWGGGLLDNYGLHSVLEWTSSLYAYPIAAFARILAEDPVVRARYECNIITFPGLQPVVGLKAVLAPQAVAGLQAVAKPQAAIPATQAAPELKAAVGLQVATPATQAVPGLQAATAGLQEVHIPRCADPIFYANRVLETVEVFLPQIHEQSVANGVEAMLTAPEEYKSRPTKEDCAAAQTLANKVEPGSKDRWTHEYNDCLKDQDSAGKPMPHNLNLAFSKVLIELSRFLANPFYLQSPARAGNAEQMRDFFFVLMPRQQRYFVDHLNPESLKELHPPCIAHFCWWYSEPVSHVEDTDHGSMDMTYLGPFLRDIHRLRAAAANVGELYSIGPKQLEGFALTFTGWIAQNTNVMGGNFRSDVAGRQDKNKPRDDADNLCDGWLELTQADAKVWDLCHEMSLRNVGGQQPYLRIGNHSVLLATKQFLP